MALLWKSPKDPHEVKDYEIDWLPELGSDTIATSTWTVPAGVTKVSDTTAYSSTRTVIKLSGGTTDEDYTLLNHIVTASGDEFDQSVILQVRDK